MSNPFIKVEWEDVAENFTPERIKRVKTYFQNKYNATHVQVITKTLSQKQNTKLTWELAVLTQMQKLIY